MLRSSDSSTQPCDCEDYLLPAVHHIYWCFPFHTSHLQNCYTMVTLSDATQATLFFFLSFSESILPLSSSHSASPLSYLTPLPPALLSPRLLPNGGISLQPPGLAPLLCTGRTHFMLYDYISLAAIWDRISQSVWGAHRCVKNSIKYIYIHIVLLQCIPANQQTQLRTGHPMHAHSVHVTHLHSHM